jgi:VWFA-related protein
MQPCQLILSQLGLLSPAVHQKIRDRFSRTSEDRRSKAADAELWEDGNPVKLVLTAVVLAATLISSPISSPAVWAQQSPAVPDAPAPQATPPLLGADGNPVTPGKGENTEPAAPASSSSEPAQQQAPPSSLPPSATQGPDNFQTAPPEGMESLPRFVLNTNFVEIPVTVKDSKGKLVAGLTWRDFKIFENNTREQLALFTVDPTPLSIAFVIDQSVTSDVMTKVNNSLGAIQGALTPYDELAVFSYSNGSQNRSGGFTGAQSARVPYVLSMTKETGEDEQVPVNSGPLAGCSIRQNGNCVDPNLQPGKSAGDSAFITIPKEIHTLNDAILAAAKELSTRPQGRRRVIYVVSDGKEYGSKATAKEVIHFLQANNTAVYGTLVGTSALWGEGFVDRFHLPFTMYDNVLYKYIAATGGTADSEQSLNGIEKSYAKIAEEARDQYTLGYYTHEPFIDGKYRKIDVRVERPGLDVKAKPGYYPNARDTH